MLDIDKVYTIMAALDNNGLYKEYFEGDLELINKNTDTATNFTEEELILNKELSEIVFGTEVKDIKISNPIISNFIQKITNFVSNGGDLRLEKDFVFRENQIIYQDEDLVSMGYRLDRPQLRARIDTMFGLIRHEVLNRTSLEANNQDQKSATQNTILENIISIYNDPRTLFASTSPTTMEPVNEVVEEQNLESELRNHWNPMTDIFVNQTTSVGKKDIGISAVAQKAFYALTYYYNTKLDRGESILNFKSFVIPGFFFKDGKSRPILSLGFPGMKFNTASIEALKNHIITNFEEDARIPNQYIEPATKIVFMLSTDGYIGIKEPQDTDFRWIKEGSRIGDFIPTSPNSSIISSSTDNAKEMKMDLLKATPEILPAYEYCLSLGIDIGTSASIFTDSLVDVLINISRGDYFAGLKGNMRISSILQKNSKLIKEKYAEYIGERLVEGKFENKQLESEFSEKIKLYKMLFKGANELTSLGQFLGINQGVKVETGEPIIFKLKIERVVNDALGENNFSIERFLHDPAYEYEYIARLEKEKTSFNILDVISTVPHYKQMFEVPIQFKNVVKMLSKDIDIAYNIAESTLAKDYYVDTDLIRNVLRVVNDRKIFDFFKVYPFEYESNLYYKVINNNNDCKEVALKESTVLSTNTKEGLLTLKPYIENVIIKELKKLYPDNRFVQNLKFNSIYNPLFRERVNFIGSQVDLTNPQYEDITAIIRNHFYSIQNEVINGHSVYEWMFVYDLLVNKHNISRNSISPLLDGSLQLADDTSIASKWVKYINEYDKSEVLIKKLGETSYLPDLRSKRANDNFEPEFSYDEDPTQQSSRRRLSSFVDPSILPLFVFKDKFTEIPMIDKNLLSEAVRNLIVTFKVC